ncbi:MAG: hypothetical protein EOO61_09525 [Hymenobacter sp.]|nr:MAG: hypothetical protein EOO61_09525 [Hymenobacter sp.]
MPALLPPPTTASYPTRAFDTDLFAIDFCSSAQGTQRVTNRIDSTQATVPTLLDTETRLLFTRTEKLLPSIWQDWYAKAEYLDGIDAQDALIRVRRLLLAMPLAASIISAGFTYEQSLYVRAELMGQTSGTLYAEVNLGDEADDMEDSFISLRKNKQEKWSTSGPFSQVLAKLRHYLSSQG